MLDRDMSIINKNLLLSSFKNEISEQILVFKGVFKKIDGSKEFLYKIADCSEQFW